MPRLIPFAIVVLFIPALGMAQVLPERAIETMKVAPDLQIELFAHEPDLINPTSIDVDHLGRVWVCEAVNYRRVMFNRPILRPEGDRIVILEDTKGVGKADKVTVFYQGKDLIAPIGIAVAPIPGGKTGACKVFVCQSPDILVFEDLDGDGKADGPPKKLLSGFGGFDSDHGVHGINIGPDGKLYFTVGDTGVKGLQSSDGKGRKWTSNSTDCRAGTVWRCDMDGKNLELIAHNFRNPYECCVNSFGDIWLSDNDDDGTQQTRICYIMPGGDYGYHPRGPGESHWHEEKPGIVHKVLRTGFGAPAGICFYEGTLLPERFRGQLLHCDPGPREFRCFHIKPKGAGFELEKEVLVTSTDTWFRLSDCCVAPDGSVFLADWYDPGVGGHGMGDWTRGRIYRVTPKGQVGYTVPKVYVGAKHGIIEAIESPNLAVREMAASAVNAMTSPKEILDIVMSVIRHASGELKARLFWAVTPPLSHVLDPSKTINAVGEMMLDGANDKVRVLPMLLRLDHDTIQFSFFKTVGNGKTDIDAFLKQILTTPAARREALLCLRDYNLDFAKSIFYPLADKYDGQDLFYLAALNIACGTDPKRREAILEDFDKQFPEWNDKVADLVWELRPKVMLPKLEEVLKDPKLTPAQKARIVDILAASDDPAAGKVTLTLLRSKLEPEVKQVVLENIKKYLPTKWKGLRIDPIIDELVKRYSAWNQDASVAITLIVACERFISIPFVQQCSLDPSRSSAVRRQALQALGDLRNIYAAAALEEFVWNQRDIKDRMLMAEAIHSLGKLLVFGTKYTYGIAALNTLQDIVLGANLGEDMKSSALSALAGNQTGSEWLFDMNKQGRLPVEFISETGRLLRNSPFKEIHNKAMIAFPPPGKLDPKKLPSIPILAKRAGDATRGRNILAASLKNEAQCLKCHTVRGLGGQVGPDLSMIGKKASRENLIESILLPSKAIAEQYIQYSIETKTGQQLLGLVVQQNASQLTLRDANGKDYIIARGDIESMNKSLVSIMPTDIVAALSEDELTDLVEYLLTLKTPSLTPDYWDVAGPFPGGNDNAGLDVEHGPGQNPFDPDARFDTKAGKLGWRQVRRDATGYVDLAAFHGDAANDSVSYLYREIESPVDQSAEILLGTDDGAKLFVNGEQLYCERVTRAAAPEQARVKVRLKKGINTLLLKIANGNNPHGCYFTLLSDQELKPGR